VDRDAVLKVVAKMRAAASKHGEKYRDVDSYRVLQWADDLDALAAADGGRGEVAAKPAMYGLRNVESRNILRTTYRDLSVAQAAVLRMSDNYTQYEVVELYAANPAPPAGVDGWKLVPVTPDEAMIEAASKYINDRAPNGDKSLGGNFYYYELIQRIISAAPSTEAKS
jgi:hypothetical protein